MIETEEIKPEERTDENYGPGFVTSYNEEDPVESSKTSN